MTQSSSIKRVKMPCDFSDARLYNRAYIPLFHNAAEFLHLFGSAGSGKSMFAAQREIVESFEWARRNRKTLVIRKVGTTLKDSVYAELKGIIYDWGLEEHFEILKSPLSITNKLTGVEFLFKGLDDPEKIKSIKGVDRVWIEEATELDRIQELSQLRLRLRGFEDVQIVLSYNPINVHHWLNTEIHEKRPEGHYIFKSTYRDNEKMLAVSPGYADYIEGLKDTDSNYYRVYGLGEWGQNLEGVIYPQYDTVTATPGVQFYGLDFGWNDPCVLVGGYILDVPGLPKKDYIVTQLLYETQHTSATLIKRFQELGVNRNLRMICDNARPEMIADLKRAGYNAVACQKYQGSVRDGINAVKKYNIKIVAGAKETYREIQNYVWEEKDGRILDEPGKNQVDHAMDAMRYALEAVRKPTGRFYSA